MGNLGLNFNVTVTTDNTTQSGSNYTGTKPQYFPPFRPVQKFSEIEIELAAFGIIGILGILINLLIVIEIQRRFKSIPYILLQNIAVVDLLTPILNGPFFIVGLLIHTLGDLTPVGCNIQGFFHTSLSTVFVNSVTLIALSRYMAVLCPAVYHRFFVNKTSVRIMMMALWSSSALICVPPMNGWGAYKRFEGTCWLAWLPSQRSLMAYNVIMTSLPLVSAVVLCIMGLMIVKKFNKVGSTGDNTGQPMDDGQSSDASSNIARVNTEVLSIASFQLLVYILLWVPLSVMNWLFLEDWSIVDFRINITFIFLFFARSVINPIFTLTVSSNIGRQFGRLCLGRNGEVGRGGEERELEM